MLGKGIRATRHIFRKGSLLGLKGIREGGHEKTAEA
jgi:hypothetical protein